MVGFRSTTPDSQTTTGTSSTPTWNRSRSVCTSGSLSTAVDGKRDLDGALDDHEEAGVLLAELVQHLARADAASRADAGDPADLSRRQLGEHLVAALDVHLCHVVSSFSGGLACRPR